MLAVEPGILRRPRPGRTCAARPRGDGRRCVYLELPLRAGPFRAPLVYGHPETWDGFWYVVLAEQFRGSLCDPFGDLAASSPTWSTARSRPVRAARALLSRSGSSRPSVRRPRYALLTGIAAVITCFFAASYVNADIGRYYLVPA